MSKTLQRLRQRSAPQDVAVLDESAGYLKYIPCTGHSRIYLLRFDEVLAIRSKLSGVFVVRSDGMECFTELTLRTLESRTRWCAAIGSIWSIWSRCARSASKRAARRR